MKFSCCSTRTHSVRKNYRIVFMIRRPRPFVNPAKSAKISKTLPPGTATYEIYVDEHFYLSYNARQYAFFRNPDCQSTNFRQSFHICNCSVPSHLLEPPPELPFGCMASYEQKSIPDRCADGIFPSSQGFLTVSAATAQTC